MPNALSSLKAGVSRGVNPMALGDEAEMSAVNDGISGTADIRTIQRTALANGYVAGYIMGSAPALTFALSKKKVKDKDPEYNIVAKESKPSRPLRVLLALPARCVCKGGTLAKPADIEAAHVDFNTIDANEMIYQAFEVDAAIGYINALGGKLPEYAPNVVDGATAQWPADVILNSANNGNGEASFVVVHAVENRNATSLQDKFKFSLKTTSDRRSLYTRGNIVCLRALEHMPVKCSSEEDAYTLNEAAFGGWKYRQPKTEKLNGLDKAIANCPSQIWRKKYTINGETVDGIGSVFFMTAHEEKLENGETVTQRPINYYPWWQTGALRPAAPTTVSSMVKRVKREADGEKKERMVTLPVLYKESPNHQAFKAYSKFVNGILNKYIREDTLKNLGGRSTKAAKKRNAGLTPEQQSALRNFLRTAEVEAQITAVQDEAADRSVLKGI